MFNSGSSMRFSSQSPSRRLEKPNSIYKGQLYNRIFKRQLTRQFTYKDINQIFKKLQPTQPNNPLTLQKQTYSPFVLRNYSPQRVIYQQALRYEEKQQKSLLKLPLMKERLTNIQGSSQTQDILRLSKLKYFPRNSIERNSKCITNIEGRLSQTQKQSNLNATSCSFLNKTNLTFTSNDKENFSILNSTRSKMMFGNKNHKKKVSDIYPLQKLLQKKQCKTFRSKWFTTQNYTSQQEQGEVRPSIISKK